MTVKELIAELATFPQDAKVLHREYSDYSELEPGQIRLWNNKIICHKGHFMDCPKEWIPDGVTPEYTSAIVFPGN